MTVARRSPRPLQSPPASVPSLAPQSRAAFGMAAEELAGRIGYCLAAIAANSLLATRRSVVYRQLVWLQLQQLWLLRPRPPHPQGRSRACPPGFNHIDTFTLPRLGGHWRYLFFVAIDRATRLMTMQVASSRDMASAVAFLAHYQEFYPFHLYQVLTDNRQASMSSKDISTCIGPTK